MDSWSSRLCIHIVRRSSSIDKVDQTASNQKQQESIEIEGKSRKKGGGNENNWRIDSGDGGRGELSTGDDVPLTRERTRRVNTALTEHSGTSLKWHRARGSKQREGVVCTSTRTR